MTSTPLTNVASLFQDKSFEYNKETVKANNERWESGITNGEKTSVGRRYAQRDLAIKSVAIVIIGGANLVVIGGLLAVMILYCPIPSEALFVSPFVVGVFLAAARLKLPTWDINRYTYSYLSNPMSLVGEVTTYTFFGPYQYAVKRIDFTDYSHAETAAFISREMAGITFIHEDDEGKKYVTVHEFEAFAETYLGRSKKLKKYGYISQETRKKLDVIYREYKYFRSDLKNQVAPYVKDHDAKIYLSSENKKSDALKSSSKGETEVLSDAEEEMDEDEEITTPTKETYKDHCQSLYDTAFESAMTAEDRYALIVQDLAKQYEAIQEEVAQELPFPKSRRAHPGTVTGTAQRAVNVCLRRAISPTPTPMRKVD